ncbi:MAG TPA: tetratricopeptide repeat protein, partial [Candidatus Coatesbacteria bacterium]|nr:tetratricopeptide repeat protein [Candidatus Coatesbacteria bacterium]
HSLVREVTYRSLLVDERRKLHRDVARAMVELDESGRGASYAPGEVAVHFDLAGCPSAAAGYFLKSYEAKKNYGSYDQAEKEAQRALELAQEPSAASYAPGKIQDPMLAERARLALADVLSLLGRAEESLPLLERAFSGSMELENRANRAKRAMPPANRAMPPANTRLAVKVCLLAVQSLCRLNRAGDIGVWVQRARRAAGDDPFLEIEIAVISSYPDMFAGNYEQAAKILEQAAALLPDPRTDEEIQAMALVHGNLAILYSYMHLRSESEHQFRRAIELAERTGDRSLVLDNRLNLSFLLMTESRLEDALEMQRRCAEDYEAMGYHLGLSQALFYAARIELELGEGKRAAADLEKSLAVSRRIHDEAHIARTALFLGYHLTRSGRLDEAFSLIDEALRLYEKNDFDKKKGLAYAVRAYHDARAGEADSARRFLKLAEENPVVDSKPPQDEVLKLAREELEGEGGVS